MTTSPVNLDGLRVGMASRRDASDILSLVNLVQPHVPWTKTDLDWQHFHSPAGASRLHAIWSGGLMVAIYGAVPKRFQAPGGTVTAFMIQDVMTHPDFRGRGLLNHLAGLCTDELRQRGEVGYTFPNKASENSFRRGGWTELMRVPLRSRAPADTPTPRGDCRIEPQPGPFDGRVSDIWAGSALALGVHRDRAYLNWRYERPGTDYRKFTIDGDAGFLILKKFADGTRITVHICDLVVHAEALDKVAATLRHASAFAAEQRAGLLTCWLPRGHPYEAAYEAHGLHLDPDLDRFAFVLAAAELLPRLREAEAWHLSQGDSDVY